MSREVRRVPLDFDWPLRRVWEGYLSPDKFDGLPCPDCKNGYSPHAQNLFDLWYGYTRFDPASTGSTPFTPETPGVRAFAERNVGRDRGFYDNWLGTTGEETIVREATRLADRWNGMWMHHVSQADVDALVAADRLWDLTRTWSREEGWRKIDPPPTPTAEQVNDWSIRGLGHDSINASVVIRARCEREGVPVECATCGGHGSLEAYEGQRAEAEAWEPTSPPEGDGWQLWETVSEGSPISPVFASSEALVAWMSSPERGDEWVPPETAAKFVEVGWAPTGAVSSSTGGMSGVEFIGWDRSEE